MLTYEDSFEIQTTLEDFNNVVEALKTAGYELLEADIEYVPSMDITPVNEYDIKNLKKMIEVLEEKTTCRRCTTTAPLT